VEKVTGRDKVPVGKSLKLRQLRRRDKVAVTLLLKNNSFYGGSLLKRCGDKSGGQLLNGWGGQVQAQTTFVGDDVLLGSGILDENLFQGSLENPTKESEVFITLSELLLYNRPRQEGRFIGRNAA